MQHSKYCAFVYTADPNCCEVEMLIAQSPCISSLSFQSSSFNIFLSVQMSRCRKYEIVLSCRFVVTFLRFCVKGVAINSLKDVTLIFA